MDRGAARERVRLARALVDLPAPSAAMASGDLSYSKLRALTRVAPPESEGELLELAQEASGGELERLLRIRRISDADESATPTNLNAKRCGRSPAASHSSRTSTG